MIPLDQTEAKNAFVENGFDFDQIDANLDKINRLFDAASRGGPAGSGGEQRARELAKLMSKAIEECAGTDMEIVEGAAVLMCYASLGGSGYCAARKMLDQRGYKRKPRRR
ncbi:MAG: hypothetical protein AAFX93_14010 [Verrucomicrobiota bacterium]